MAVLRLADRSLELTLYIPLSMVQSAGLKRGQQSDPKGKKKTKLVVVDEEVVEVKNARGVPVWTTRVVKPQKASTSKIARNTTPKSSRYRRISLSPDRGPNSDIDGPGKTRSKGKACMNCSPRMTSFVNGSLSDLYILKNCLLWRDYQKRPVAVAPRRDSFVAQTASWLGSCVKGVV